jgi:hypothetical protein
MKNSRKPLHLPSNKEHKQTIKNKKNRTEDYAKGESNA